ncbi:hypothetical protein VPNG_07157 [Cytospora leucostoma]|uniref:Uncharacterized protein n=1 Tax=Cytospora leucostoma TaxID=1230097 RepID=A0A423WJS0_9PEZI|nr:hypothetical protein VPNG_07157 [Cytospora leucostoma]
MASHPSHRQSTLKLQLYLELKRRRQSRLALILVAAFNLRANFEVAVLLAHKTQFFYPPNTTSSINQSKSSSNRHITQ